jgi:hypothetical protein
VIVDVAQVFAEIVDGNADDRRRRQVVRRVLSPVLGAGGASKVAMRSRNTETK